MAHVRRSHARGAFRTSQAALYKCFLAGFPAARQPPGALTCAYTDRDAVAYHGKREENPHPPSLDSKLLISIGKSLDALPAKGVVAAVSAPCAARRHPQDHMDGSELPSV